MSSMCIVCEEEQSFDVYCFTIIIDCDCHLHTHTHTHVQEQDALLADWVNKVNFYQ